MSWRTRGWLTSSPLLPATAASAQTAAALVQDADLPPSERLSREHRCAERHCRKAGGDGAATDRPQCRTGTPGALRGRVGPCKPGLNLAPFGDEVDAIAAVLKRDHDRSRSFAARHHRRVSIY